MKKILLTGFEPFLKETLNPSQQLVEIYRESQEVETLVLPVSYNRSWEVLKEHLEKNQYDFILMLGQAGGRRKVSLEMVALNLRDTETADEDGDVRLQERISSEGPDAYLSPLPLRSWVQQLQKKKLPVEVSLTAGGFVCNSIYFQVVDYLKNQKLQTNALFVHVPFIKEQVANRSPEVPFLELQEIKKVIDELLLIL